MKINDIMHETQAALSANKIRSGLTILGIVIGVASVIAMVSIGTGAQNRISTSIEGLGTNLLTILPGIIQPGRGIVSAGRGSAETLKPNDLSVLAQIDGIAAISPELSRRFQITSSTGNNTNTTVTGVGAQYPVVHSITLAEGNFISDANVRSFGREAVLGATAATDLFAADEPLGKTIRINGSSFTVVGVLDAKGGIGFSGPDDMIFIPLATMQKVVSGSDNFSSIAVSVTDKDQMAFVQAAITDALLAKHRVATADFSVISQQDILGTLSSVIQTFTLFLASIAGISLLVGGIGIMNMMLTTVTERTREIGLRKAIGARKSDIRAQFLAEAVVLTTIGGIAGIVLGWIVSYMVSLTGLVQTSVSLVSVVLAFGVSAITGIIFGYYPARRAAGLNPIEALRYE